MLTKGRCASHANLKLVKQSLKEKKKKHDKKSSPCSQLLLIGKFFHKRSRDYSKVKSQYVYMREIEMIYAG